MNEPTFGVQLVIAFLGMMNAIGWSYVIPIAVLFIYIIAYDYLYND